jgi:hypothetical protein
MLVLLPLLVLACQNATVPVVRRAVATASATPTATATVRPTPVPTPARPTTPVVELHARLAVDAGYLVSKGLGAVVTNNGARVVLTGNALISDHGGGLISDHGGGIISDKGAGLVSNNAGNRRLLATPGELLPAAGVQVHVRSLRTGQPLPLGVGPDGQPLYTTVSDGTGAVLAYIPQDEQGNVLVQAVVQGSQDARGRYDLVTSPKAPAVVDEDTAQATAFLRVAFAGRVESLLVDDPAKALCELGSSDAYSPAVQAVLQQTVRDLHDAASQAGVVAGPGATALARAMSDAVLSAVDLGAIEVTPETYTGWDKREPAITAVVEVLRAVRDQATARLAGDPGYFKARPYIQEGNSCKPGTYEILKAADLNAFIVQEYLASSTNGALTRMRSVIDDVDARHPGGLAEDQAIRMSAAANAVESALALAFVTDQDGARTAAMAILKAYDPKAPVTASPRPQPCWHEDAADLKGCPAASPSPAP